MPTRRNWRMSWYVSWRSDGLLRVSHYDDHHLLLNQWYLMTPEIPAPGGLHIDRELTKKAAFTTAMCRGRTIIYS